MSVKETLESLVREEDTDEDLKITIDDPRIPGTERGDKRFWIRALDGKSYEVTGAYYLATLLQELKLAEESGFDKIQLATSRLFEKPVDRISRSIRELYWDGLTRRVDEMGLVRILSDEKTVTVDGLRYVYVPASDERAYRYFAGVADRRPEWKMKVVRLPEETRPEYVRGLDGRHGILSLSVVPAAGGGLRGEPFVVPGGRFNEMYGWDSYFILLGLLEDGRVDLARSMVDNLVYEITHYGAVLNANRTYFLTRSQPPFLTSMVRALYERLPKDEASKKRLKAAIIAAAREYREVWTGASRLTKTGLSRYYDSGYGPPPEVEPGHFAVVYRSYARSPGWAQRLLKPPTSQVRPGLRIWTPISCTTGA